MHEYPHDLGSWSYDSWLMLRDGRTFRGRLWLLDWGVLIELRSDDPSARAAFEDASSSTYRGFCWDQVESLEGVAEGSYMGPPRT